MMVFYCSLTRKPFRFKGRESSLSMYSVTTLSSDDCFDHTQPVQKSPTQPPDVEGCAGGTGDTTTIV